MQKKKVYLAILNSGWLRREVMSKVLPDMLRTKDIELIWEDPGKTWGTPISSNRNAIVKRFLETDCDFLLMLDNDVVPLHNPCELAYLDCDVIGSPALVFGPGKTLTWVAYVASSSDPDKYRAIDIDSVDDAHDTVEVDIVGTGCILIKRHVLEGIKMPFHSEFDADGIQTYSTDFAFCRRAKRLGYKVYTTTHRRCKHFKTSDLSEWSAWDSMSNFDLSNKEYGIAWGGGSVTQNDWEFVKSYLSEITNKNGRQNKLSIVEFGSGLSSLLLSESCKVTTYEVDQTQADIIEAKKTAQNDLNMLMWGGKSVFDIQSTYAASVDVVLVNRYDAEHKNRHNSELAIAIEFAVHTAKHIIICGADQRNEIELQRRCFGGKFMLGTSSGTHVTRCTAWARRHKPALLHHNLIISGRRGLDCI